MAYRLEKTAGGKSLVIDGWEQGTAQSPELGVNIRNCNIESVTNTVRPSWRSNLSSIAAFTLTFTADATTDIITLSGTGATTIDFNFSSIQVSNSGGALPAGLSATTTYYMIITGGLGAGTYKLATTLANAYAGTAINITDNGTGTQSISNTASAVSMGTINYMINAPVILNTGLTVFYQFALDNTGKLWYYSSQSQWIIVPGNSSSNNVGNGLAYFVSSGGTTYLFCYTNASVDVLNVSTFITALSATWNTGWFALNTANGYTGSHAALIGQDNKVYSCDGRYVDSISEVNGKSFAPGDSTTYVQNNKALTLPSYASAQCLEELGQNLLVGDKYSNYIYPWDRVSTSFIIPMRVAENNIQKMKNVDNTVFILAGTKGHVFQTTGYQVQRIMKIPEYITGGDVTWGGMEKVSSSLVFGMTAPTSAAGGTYKLYTNVGQFAGSIVGSLISDETPSIGATNVTAILSDMTPTEFYFMGYAGGIDLLDTTNRYSNYESYVESDIIPVGSFLEPATYQNIEYKLDYAPTSGGVRLSWRTNLQPSYTVIKDFNCASVISDFTSLAVQNVQWLQIKAEIKGGTGFIDCPRLREIRLR